MSTTCRVGVDIGGTFTDLVVETPGGLVTRKVLTTPRAPEEGVLAGLESALAAAGVTPAEVGLVVHGTTLATNAIIERKGTRTALVATEGFRDTLDIADEGRFDQYDVLIEKPKPLVPRHLRFTVPERVSAAGEVLLALDEAAVERLIPRLREAEAGAVAVALIHAYANADHERRIKEILEPALPGVTICLSSEVCPEIREYERTSTTVANAYVQPLMAGYLGRLEEALAARGYRCPVYLMSSGGGLTTIEAARRFPIRLVESGPAGGAILATQLAARLGERQVLSLDMGGTTAKVCLIKDGRPQTARAFEVDRSARFMKGSGLPVRIPVIEMVEIGAGGGSIGRVDQLGRITVGPDSAGAEPGPACYGRGGREPAVTDADLVLGRIAAEGFADGRMTLDTDAAERALLESVGTRLALDAVGAAYGVSEIVDENMANAARVHAVESGRNVAEHAMIAFGGAAPLHAARIAEKLGIAKVVVPADAGVGSALGFLAAPVGYEIVRSRHMRLDQLEPAELDRLFAGMREEALAVVAPGAGKAPLVEKRQAYMRYMGQGHEVAVALPVRPYEAADAKLMRERFEAAYAELFARSIPGAVVEALTFALTLETEVEALARIVAVKPAAAPAPTGKRRLYDVGRREHVEVPVYKRADMAMGAMVPGPCLIEEATTTTLVAASFDARVDGGMNLVLERKETGR